MHGCRASAGESCCSARNKDDAGSSECESRCYSLAWFLDDSAAKPFDWTAHPFGATGKLSAGIDEDRRPIAYVRVGGDVGVGAWGREWVEPVEAPGGGVVLASAEVVEAAWVVVAAGEGERARRRGWFDERLATAGPQRVRSRFATRGCPCCSWSLARFLGRRRADSGLLRLRRS
jgi:hypothetical protein